jgi:WD40 repeat protein
VSGELVSGESSLATSVASSWSCGHDSEVLRLAFNPTGDRLASAGFDGHAEGAFRLGH